MKGNKVIFIILGITIIGGLLWYFFRKGKAKEVSQDQKGNLKGCITVPANAPKWTNAFTGTDWGGYAKAVRTYLPDYADDESGHLIAGFFKAIDVEPYSAYVRYFQNDLKEYLKTNAALPHWLVTQGSMRCDFNQAA